MARFDLNLLASLDALLRHRSVTSAAEEVSVSQSTMSGMLARLRDQLQDPLLVRVGAGFTLTPRAESLARDVRQLLLTVGELVRPNDDFELAQATREIRIMASEFSQLIILPRLFLRARQEAPGLRFDVVSIADPIGRVAGGDIDFCLSAVPLDELATLQSELIRTKTVLSEPLVALVDTNHPLKGAASLEEVNRFPHVVTQFPGIGISVEESSVAEAPTPSIRVPSFTSAPAMVTGSDRICFVPRRLAPSMATAHGLRVIELPKAYEPLALRILWHVRHDLDPVQRWLRTVIHEVAQALDA